MRAFKERPYDGIRSNSVGEDIILPSQQIFTNIPNPRNLVGATIGRPRNKSPLHKRGVEGAAPYRV